MTTDAELALAFRDGDDRAFTLLYERYKRPLYSFAVKMLSEADSARDLVQDVFVTAYEKREQLHSPESFRSWLFTIGRNRCLSHLRHSRKHFPLEEAPNEPMAGTGRDGLEIEEDVRMVRQALNQLSLEHREVLVLREYQDLSYHEIAEITGSTESAVKSRLFKARRALHESLKPVFAGRS